ncbi:MAG: hypothetical protein Q9214_003299 [Letrouitia sp. 1 TL-2023]
MVRGGRRMARPGRHEPQYDYETDQDSGSTGSGSESSDSKSTNNSPFNLGNRSERGPQPPPGHRGLVSLSSRGRPRGRGSGYGRAAHGRRPPPGRGSGHGEASNGRGIPSCGQNLMAGPTDDLGYLIDPGDGDKIESLALDIALGPGRGPPRPPFERSQPTGRGNAVNASRAGQIAIYHMMDPESCPAHRDSPSSADESDICESLLRKTCVAAARAAGYMGFDHEEIQNCYSLMCERLE